MSSPFSYSAAASGAICTPSLVYSVSLKPDLTPASFSIQTSWPRRTRSPAAAGTSATRPSRVLVSLGTPIRIAGSPLRPYASRERLTGNLGFAMRDERFVPRSAPCVAGAAPPSYAARGRRVRTLRASSRLLRPANAAPHKPAIIYDAFQAFPIADPRFRPRGLDRRRLRSASEPQARARDRPADGRSIDDDHRSRQLARRCARPDGPRPDDAPAGTCRTLRYGSHLRSRSQRRSLAAPVPAQGRQRRIHRRR